MIRMFGRREMNRCILNSSLGRISNSHNCGHQFAFLHVQIEHHVVIETNAETLRYILRDAVEDSPAIQTVSPSSRAF